MVQCHVMHVPYEEWEAQLDRTNVREAKVMKVSSLVGHLTLTLSFCQTTPHIKPKRYVCD